MLRRAAWLQHGYFPGAGVAEPLFPRDWDEPAPVEVASPEVPETFGFALPPFAGALPALEPPAVGAEEAFVPGRLRSRDCEDPAPVAVASPDDPETLVFPPVPVLVDGLPVARLSSRDWCEPAPVAVAPPEVPETFSFTGPADDFTPLVPWRCFFVECV